MPPRRTKKTNESPADEPEIDDNLGDEDLAQQFRYTITSYGADYPVDSVVKRMLLGSIFVPTFQRQFVWNLTQSSRFIESLLLGLPVPGIFLSKEQDTKKLLVIDGQQRLLTLKHYYAGIFADTGREFALRGVQEQFKNLTYKKLGSEDRRVLDDAIIHATIVQQDQPKGDDSSIYHIFERLNTGGTLLRPQEIRACVYHGSFNALLKTLNKTEAWREIFGKESARMRDCELILRFLAFYFNEAEYEPPMNEFLNNFMAKHRNPTERQGKGLTDLFSTTVEVANKALGKTAFRPRKTLNAAVFDSVMVGLARRLMSGPVKNMTTVRSRYGKLMENDTYLLATEQGTAKEEAVEARMHLAIQAFATIA